MKGYLLYTVVAGLLFGLTGCEKKCVRVEQPVLYFTLVDQAGKPLLPDNNTRRLAIVYKNRSSGGSVMDTVRSIATLGSDNPKYPSIPLLVSASLLMQSAFAESATFQILLDKKQVGTLQLTPFQKNDECDTWIYTSNVTFNGQEISPAGATSEVYLLPVVP